MMSDYHARSTTPPTISKVKPSHDELCDAIRLAGQPWNLLTVEETQRVIMLERTKGLLRPPVRNPGQCLVGAITFKVRLY